MAFVIRFVDKNGYEKRFLDLIHVQDATSSSIMQGICSILSHYNHNIQNVRGQRYDGASNMRGEWNALQALILRECPCVYYAQHLARQLQLVRIASVKEVVDVHAYSNMVVNVVCSSCKHNCELQAAYATEIRRLVANDEIETRMEANQIGTLHRPEDIRWSFHFNSMCKFLCMYNTSILVLENLANKGITYDQQVDATYALKTLISFDVVFILHVTKEIMGITDKLVQAKILKTF